MDEETYLKSYCGNCDRSFKEETYYCPECGSNLVDYDTREPFKKNELQQKWERHNRGFKMPLKDNKRQENLN